MTFRWLVIFVFTFLAVFSLRNRQKYSSKIKAEKQALNPLRASESNFVGFGETSTKIPEAKENITDSELLLPKHEFVDAKSKEIDSLMDQAIDYFNSGNLYLSFGKFEEIERLDPQNRNFLEFYSSALAENGNWNKALYYLERCVEIYPQSEVCQSELSAYARDHGTDKDRKRTIERCLENNPRNADCIHDLAELWTEQAEYQKSYEQYQRILSMSDKERGNYRQEYLFHKMGLSSEKLGETQLAIFNYQEACRLNNESACARIRNLSSKEAEH